jgi:amino acid adenylation domain-containing protein/thioester reductase-like protein
MKNLTPETSPLSCGQQALWYLNQLEPDSTAYHLGLCLELHGVLDEAALALAWADIGLRHPQLRARFIIQTDVPSVAIEAVPAPLRVEAGGAENLKQFWQEIAERPFNLDREAPVRALLLRGSNGVSHLLLCSHHIVTDLWSSAIILRELSAGYRARMAGGNAPTVAGRKMEYPKFAFAERRWLAEPEGCDAWNFWRHHFDGVRLDPILTRNVGNGTSGEVPLVLAETEGRLIRQVAREKATTPYAVLLAGYARLLGEETGLDELIIGSPATLRNRAALRNTVGYFVNAVPVRCPVGPGGGDAVGIVAANAQNALRQRRFPFPVLVERLGIPRIPGTTPIFQSMFAYQSLPRADRGFLALALSGGGAQWEFGGGIAARTVAMPAFDAQFPIALALGPEGEGFSGNLQFDGRRVTAPDAVRLAERFPDLIREFLTGKKPKLPKALPTNQGERLEHLFDQTVRRMPSAMAVKEGSVNLSYVEVQTRAEVLAAGLAATLPDDDRPVALQMSSCAEASIMILAILKSGRAFMPIDPGEPVVRRNAALLRAGSDALVSPAGFDAGVLPEGVIPLNPEQLGRPQPPVIRPRKYSKIAYLIYTSGSTGEPKAVEVEHAAVINHARAVSRLFGLTPNDRVLQFHTLAFDAAFEEIFPSWIAGAGVVFEPRARNVGVPAFLELVQANGITVLNLPTSYWHTLTSEAVRLQLDPGSTVRLLIVGGEQASACDYSAWRQLAPGCRWINTYGPTETTITALAYEPDAPMRGNVPIGQPIDGVSALLVNEVGQSIPFGIGELLIGGKGLALGYRGDTETTAAKFVERRINGGVQRYYRTGDRVRRRRDGNFEYLGRLDRQLKIRGYRLDPDEIERVFRLHPSVLDAVVKAQTVAGELILAGWITCAEASLTERELRDHLLRHLPAHMFPSRLNFVARLPRKPSGKIDMAALDRTDQPEANPQRQGSRELAALFSELLGHKVGPQDDFFLVGGHSLLAIKLLGRIETQFGTRVALSDFVAAPTAKKLWEQLQTSPVSHNLRLEADAAPETPVSAQQKRALIAHEIELPSLANIVLLLRMDGQFDVPAFERAVAVVARQNFLLRAGFFRTESGIVLRETEPPKLEHHTLAADNFKQAVVELARVEGRRPFKLDEPAPWLRLLLVSDRANQNQHLILITHHAIADGWAFEVLLDDLRAQYQHGELQKPVRDYRAYAQQQARWLKSPEAQEQISFWQARLANAPEPRLPWRRPTAGGSSWQVEQRELTLPSKLSRDFRRVAAAYGTTPFALAMACFKALIHRYAGQTDLTLGTVVSNRITPADQILFGPLQNPVLIRDEVTSDLSLRALVQQVARSLVEAQKHGALPFERVLQAALPSPSIAREGGIQFLSRDHDAQTFQLGDTSVHSIELPAQESPFELSVAVSLASPRVKIECEYQPTAYDASGIVCLMAQYAALLKAVVEAPSITVGELNLFPATQQRALQRRISKKFSPRRELLHAGFESEAAKNPQATAIITRERCLTYGELNSRSDATANALREQGLKAPGLVAVMLPKGWEQVVACLAILKAGGGYVPLDPAAPAERLKTIFEQGGFHAAIVADADAVQSAATYNLPAVITVYSRAKDTPKFRQAKSKPEALAYVIFTSGSTGIPKGVMVSHQAALTTIAEINRRFQISRNDRVFAISALGFDLSVFDIFGTLRAGGTVVIPDSQDPKDWLEQVVAGQVTVWNSVPCLFELLLDEAGDAPNLAALRLILLSGDFISVSLARRIRTTLPAARLVSLGGATEGAIWSIAREVDELETSWHRIPYGRALSGQEVFVMDDALNHCAAGVTGELFIAGAGLANGYWRNRQETNRRFRRHPRWNIRLYRTGDQGRYLAIGEIEILGRLDGQVKLNGVRIELGEVEAALGSLPSVRQAVAEIRLTAAEHKNLVAFVVVEPGTTTADLIDHANKILPAALRPSTYMPLDQLPLTGNGKIDRVALRARPLPVPVTEVTLPETPAELWIANLWSTLLGGISVGVEDDFFSLGGHSLLAIKMLQRVRSHFSVDMPLSLVIEHPTVRGLARAINLATLVPTTGLPQRATSEFEPDSEPIISEPIGRTEQPSQAILLTGATGHLGSVLLRELLSRTSDSIYCLIRAGSRSAADLRLREVLESHKIATDLWPRLVAIPADLSRERLGLDASTFDDLARAIYAVYHCAAEVNFIAPYEKLAAGNVGGVREIIRLTTLAGAVLHHVSSVAVFPYGGSRILREDEDISRIPRLAGGYAQTKWTSELMVWKAMARGLRAVIYRPAQIVGRTAGPAHDLFDHALQACQSLEAVPDIETKIDMVTSDYVAAAIYSLSIRATSLGKAFHLVHPNPVSLRDFVSQFPTPLPLVPLDVWLTSLNQAARHRDDSSLHFLAMLTQGLNRADLTPPGFDCSEAVAGLHGTGVICPPLNRQFIQRELVLVEELP